MPRFVVRYRGRGPRPEDVVQRIRATPGTSIVDDGDRMLLVDAPEGSLEGIVGTSDEWLVAPEKSYPIPDTRKRIQRRSSDS